MKYYKVFDISLGYKVSVWGKCLHFKILNQFPRRPFLRFIYNPSKTQKKLCCQCSCCHTMLLKSMTTTLLGKKNTIFIFFILKKMKDLLNHKNQ
jgi:hypothetical protein